MKRESHKDELVMLIKSVLQEKDSQGYNVRVLGKMDYCANVLNELYILENFSDDCTEELLIVSRYIRKNIFGKESDEKLYFILHTINGIMQLFSEAIGTDIYWDCNMVIEYAVTVCKYEARWVSDSSVNSLIDQIQTVNAKRIIDAQWRDVLASSDGIKTFMKVFDDVFTTAIEKEPEKYIYSLKDTDILCRMVKEKDCDEQRFIPLPNSRSQNRWNPPGKAFLYMSYGREEHEYSRDLSLEQRVCLLECRTEANTDCSFCYFEPTVSGKIFDLSFNDSELTDYREMLNQHEQKVIADAVNGMLQDEEIVARAADEKYIKQEIKKRIHCSKTKSVVTEATTKQYLKLICSCIYYKVDGTEEEKEKQYHSFHILSAYLQSKGITGIIYPCTRDESIKGKNIVLFEPNDAKPIIGSIKRYHYAG